MDCDNSPTSKMLSRIPNIIDQRREKCLATAQTIATLKKCLLVVLCRISSFLGQGDVGIWGDLGVCTMNNYGDLFWSLVKTRDTIYGDLYWSLLLEKSIKMTNFLRLLTGQKSLSEGVAKCSDCSDQFGSWFRTVTKMRKNWWQFSWNLKLPSVSLALPRVWQSHPGPEFLALQGSYPTTT